MRSFAPKFEYDLQRSPVVADQIHETLPNYDKAIAVDRVAIDAISAQTFMTRYVAARRPVVLVGGIKHWNAYSRWDPDYLKSVAGTDQLDVTKCLFLDFALMALAKRLSRKEYWSTRKDWMVSMSLAEYVESCTTGFNPNEVLYARDIPLPNSLAEDIGDIPVFATSLRPKGVSWFIGRRTYTDAHEHDGADAFLCQVRGRKEVILHPPDVLHQRALYATMSLRNWSPVRFFDVDRSRFPLMEQSVPTIALVDAGDALYIPDPWWHAVVSADDEVEITATIWYPPPWFTLEFPQTSRRFIGQPLQAVRDAVKFGVRLRGNDSSSIA